MNASKPPLLISLKPRYADLIFDGLKKAELRLQDLRRMEGRDVFVYVSSPVMKLRGGFRVGKVLTGPPEEIWSKVSEEVRVDKSEFEAYYSGRDLACALEITDEWEYENPMDLSVLRDMYENFVVPQSWRYVKPQEHRDFHAMKRRNRGAGDAVAQPAQTSQRQSEPLLQPAA